jgi:hypothetical protein
MKTTTAITSSKWIRPPPILKLNPKSHRINKTAIIVQSIIFFLLRAELSWHESRWFSPSTPFKNHSFRPNKGVYFPGGRFLVAILGRLANDTE